jgi:hypothetical protein
MPTAIYEDLKDEIVLEESKKDGKTYTGYYHLKRKRMRRIMNMFYLRKNRKR